MKLLRIIVQTNDITNFLYTQAPVEQSIKTFDIRADKVVEYLSTTTSEKYHNVLGVEIIECDEIKPKYGFNDHEIGIMDESGNVVIKKEIDKPDGIKVSEWWEFAAKICKVLNKI